MESLNKNITDSRFSFPVLYLKSKWTSAVGENECLSLEYLPLKNESLLQRSRNFEFFTSAVGLGVLQKGVLLVLLHLLVFLFHDG